MVIVLDAAAVFDTAEAGLSWAAEYLLTGILSEYPYGGAYDIAVREGRFAPSKPHHGTADHVGSAQARAAPTSRSHRRRRPLARHRLRLHQRDGQHLLPHYLTYRFRILVTRSGLPPIRLHDLRHGAAGLVQTAGADLKTVQDQLGHASIGLTADTYTSVLDSGQHPAAAATATSAA
jgi:integrase